MVGTGTEYIYKGFNKLPSEDEMDASLITKTENLPITIVMGDVNGGWTS